MVHGKQEVTETGQIAPGSTGRSVILGAAKAMEPLPGSITRLANLVFEKQADVTAVVDAVGFDQVLTATLLRQANAAAHASSTKVGTVREAVIRLGTASVLSLALGACVSRRLNGALPQYQLAEGQLWQHSVTASLAAEQIIRLSPVALPAEVATAALIHDIGKLVIAQYLDSHVLHFDLDADRTDRRPISHTESAILDVDHNEVGALVAEHWGLPDTIRHGIAFHHAPEQDGSPLCFAVHLAELLATEVHQSPEDRELASEDADPRDEALRVLGLDSGAYASLAAKVGEQYEALATSYAVTST